MPWRSTSFCPFQTKAPIKFKHFYWMVVVLINFWITTNWSSPHHHGPKSIHLNHVSSSEFCPSPVISGTRIKLAPLRMQLLRNCCFKQSWVAESTCHRTTLHMSYIASDVVKEPKDPRQWTVHIWYNIYKYYMSGGPPEYKIIVSGCLGVTLTRLF